jgi:hypothetical protein
MISLIHMWLAFSGLTRWSESFDDGTTEEGNSAKTTNVIRFLGFFSIRSNFPDSDPLNDSECSLRHSKAMEMAWSTMAALAGEELRMYAVFQLYRD